MDAANDLENIGDIIETDLVSLGEKRIEQEVSVSPATRKLLLKFHSQVQQAVDRAIHSVTENDQEAAADVIEMKSDINRISSEIAAHQTERLLAEEPNRLGTYTLETDVIEKLKRIYYFAKRMAKNVVPGEIMQKSA